MNKPRDIRRLAMQVLYQMDVTREHDRAALAASIDDEYDAEPVRNHGLDLAIQAWDSHRDADAAVSSLTPDWPTHRQPPVDRAILRLAYHEIVSGHAPYKVAINEAVELAKHYASESSPPFINGVLDKLAKQLDSEGRLPTVKQPDPPESPDAWLSDAEDR
ncbi:transcription antitermination factor NusB [Phycisphaerales bacterium AB-hyl4]|uniref:Transcription antitermination protein NusB n=1 Tax=Natronomicrosphaera hydrolytica TaxID=3242702 RepID=A0ABV4U2R9_9BACT